MYAPSGFTNAHTSAKTMAACSHPAIVILRYLRNVPGGASRTSGTRARRRPETGLPADPTSYLLAPDDVAIEQPERHRGEQDEPDLEHHRVHRFASRGMRATRRSAPSETSGQSATSTIIQNIKGSVPFPGRPPSADRPKLSASSAAQRRPYGAYTSARHERPHAGAGSASGSRGARTRSSRAPAARTRTANERFPKRPRRRGRRLPRAFRRRARRRRSRRRRA